MMDEVCMRMWGDMIPKSGKPKFPSRITLDVLEMLVSEDDHTLEMVPYPYDDMDWRGCTNILFTPDEPPDER